MLLIALLLEEPPHPLRLAVTKIVVTKIVVAKTAAGPIARELGQLFIWIVD
jgi:hypothetical protein